MPVIGVILGIFGGGIVQTRTIAHGSLELCIHEGAESRIRAGSLENVTFIPTFGLT